jgi:DNA-binding CsgD family transcriptional regulator
VESFQSQPHPAVLAATTPGAPAFVELRRSPDRPSRLTRPGFERPRSELCLADLWRQLVATQAYIHSTLCTENRCLTILEFRAPTVAVARENREVLERVLMGECQKAVAFDRDLSISTVATLCSSALRAMGDQHLVSHAPMVFVMAAYAASGLRLDPARVVGIASPASSIITIETPAPDLVLQSFLSATERDIVRLLIEGKTYAEVAARRRRSVRTIANQLSSSFRKLNVSGRGELVARVVRDISIRQVSAREGQDTIRFVQPEHA